MPKSQLTPQQVQELKERLVEERERILEKGAAHIADATGLETRLSEEMDQASRDYDQGLLLRLADNERELVSEIDAALQRIADGSYGLSEDSGEPIGYSRLSVQPWARNSIEDQEQAEREQRARR